MGGGGWDTGNLLVIAINKRLLEKIINLLEICLGQKHKQLTVYVFLSQCNVGGGEVEQVFDQLAKELEITQDNGSICSHHTHVLSGSLSQPSSNLTCSELYYFVSQMLLRLNVTDECCLVNGTACHNPNRGQGRRKATVAEG